MPAIPRGFGDRRAAQRVFQRWLADGDGKIRHGNVGSAKLELSLDDWPQAQAYLLRRYDPSTVGFISTRLPENGVFVDGGAHVGLISCQIATARPDADIHAFEPHPSKYASLVRNAGRTSGRITPNNIGLSDAEGGRPYDPERHAVDAGGDDEIPVTTLDEYVKRKNIQQIDVLKLDVEGHELNALSGAASLLAAGRVGAVTMESLHGDTSEPMEFLEGFGYKRVEMPDVRPKWLATRRPMQIENVGYVLST